MPADLVVLEDLPCGDRLLAELERQLPRGVRRDQGEALYRDRESSPPDLRRRRRQSRQRTRSLERAGRRVAVAVTEDRGEVLGALPALCDLVERVWRGRGDGSGITHPAGRAYLHQAVATAPRGAILLTRVMVDGRLAAFDLALREGRSGVMFRGNWDADSGASGVGWISMLTTLDALRDAGVTTIDFGKFGWEYKRALTSEPRTALVTFAISRGVRGAFALGLWRARPALLAARAKVGALGERLALRLRRPRA